VLSSIEGVRHCAPGRTAHHNLGMLEMSSGHYRAAQDRSETATRLYAAVNHGIGQAEIHHKRVKITLWLGDPQAARVHAKPCACSDLAGATRV